MAWSHHLPVRRRSVSRARGGAISQIGIRFSGIRNLDYAPCVRACALLLAARVEYDTPPASLRPFTLGAYRGVNSDRQAAWQVEKANRRERGGLTAPSTDIAVRFGTDALRKRGQGGKKVRHEADREGGTIRKRGPCEGDDDVRGERGYG